MRDITDTAQLFIVRYDRNDTEDVGKQPTSKFSELYNVETDPAAQLVARYSGSNKIEQVSRLTEIPLNTIASHMMILVISFSCDLSINSLAIVI